MKACWAFAKGSDFGLAEPKEDFFHKKNCGSQTQDWIQ
jgi:hypothetical protein